MNLEENCKKNLKIWHLKAHFEHWNKKAKIGHHSTNYGLRCV